MTAHHPQELASGDHSRNEDFMANPGETQRFLPTEDAAVIARTRKLGLRLEGCAAGGGNQARVPAYLTQGLSVPSHRLLTLRHRCLIIAGAELVLQR